MNTTVGHYLLVALIVFFILALMIYIANSEDRKRNTYNSCIEKELGTRTFLDLEKECYWVAYKRGRN